MLSGKHNHLQGKETEHSMISRHQEMKNKGEDSEPTRQFLLVCKGSLNKDTWEMSSLKPGDKDESSKEFPKQPQ